MGQKKDQARGVWTLAERQHGVVARTQLLRLGFSTDAITERIARGRLHRVAQGVYVVGRPGLTRHGRWMAAVLACGSDAVLSHGSAAALWQIGRERSGVIEVSVPCCARRRRAGILIHRRATLTAVDVTTRHGIPVTTPASTLIDLASFLPPSPLESAINAADKRGWTNPEALRAAIEGLDHQRPGVAALRETLDRRTFTLTDSELERRFLRLARQVGLPLPETGCHLDGFKVDFFWPELGLVVETDGLRYHRTPTQRAKDRERDQAHTAAGRTPLRFTHAQVRYESDRVRAVLAKVVRRFET